MSKRRKGFTLTELLVVMAIMVLFITLASATLRALGGGRSISVAQNQLASLLNRAREDAIAIQGIRGVLFYLDPATSQVVVVSVQQASAQDARFPLFKMLDQIPNRESLLLPQGVGLQTVYNGTSMTIGYTNNGSDDRYMGFNMVPASNASKVGVVPIRVGGCILFDGSGRVIAVPYGLQWFQSNPGPGSVWDTALPTLLAGTLGIGDQSTITHPWNGPAALSGYPTAITLGSTSASMPFSFPTNMPPTSCVLVPGTQYIQTLQTARMRTAGVYPGVQAAPTGTGQGVPASPVLSQLGLVLFDRSLFLAQGFNDDDADINNQSYTTAWSVPPTGRKESDEELWLDENSTPIMLNRYDGTLIRSE